MGDTRAMAGGVAARARPAAGKDAEAYRGRDPRLLGGYLAVLGVQHRGPIDGGHGCRGLVGPSVARSRELVTVTLGAHMLSRTLSKGAVISPIKVPFAHDARAAGPAEVHKEVRHSSQHHWDPKKQKDSSDKLAEGGGPRNAGPSAKGVDANACGKHLLDVARRVDIRGRSTMDKPELVDAVKEHNRRAPAK